MFSITVIASNSEKCWKTMPIPSRRAALGEGIETGAPSQAMVPLSACCTP